MDMARTVSVDPQGRTMNSRSSLSPGSPCSPEVQAVIDKWKPRWSSQDPKTWQTIAPAVRGWATFASPGTVGVARELLSYSSRFVAWVYRTHHTLDPELVWTKRKVGEYVTDVCRSSSPLWKATCRSELTRLGPLFAPKKGGWPPEDEVYSRDRRSPQYSTRDELAYRESAKAHVGFSRSKVLWVVGAAFGAGLRGMDLRAVTTADVMPCPEDSTRVVITVRGRTVPVRSAYTEMVLEAVGLTPAGDLLLPGNANVANRIATSLRTSGLEPLKVERARSTWLAHHLLNSTDLLYLLEIAGLTSAESIFRIAKSLSPADPAAARKGALRA